MTFLKKFQAASCEKNIIIAKNGHWSYENNPEIIYKCTKKPNACKGEDYNSRRIINSCIEGSIGPL